MPATRDHGRLLTNDSCGMYKRAAVSHTPAAGFFGERGELPPLPDPSFAVPSPYAFGSAVLIFAGAAQRKRSGRSVHRAQCWRRVAVCIRSRACPVPIEVLSCLHLCSKKHGEVPVLAASQWWCVTHRKRGGAAAETGPTPWLAASCEAPSRAPVRRRARLAAENDTV